MARKMRDDSPSGGGREQWHIHRSYSRALRDVSTDRVPPLDGSAPADAARGDASPLVRLRQLPERVRKQAERRALILRDFRAWKSSPSVQTIRDFPAFQARIIDTYGERVSRATLYAWHETVTVHVPDASSSDPSDGDLYARAALALVDGRATRASRIGGTPGGGVPPVDGVVSAGGGEAAWARFRALYLSPTQPSAAKCYRLVRDESRRDEHRADPAWYWPGRSVFFTQLSQRVPRDQSMFARAGHDAWARKYAQPLEQHPEAYAPGERWDGDHSRLDFFCRDFRGGKWTPVRPWLTAFIDWRSRAITGWSINLSASAGTIREAMLSALRGSGGTGVPPVFSAPRIVWIDNGKDFSGSELHGTTRSERAQARAQRSGSTAQRELDDTAARGLYAHLGIEAHFAQPYNHDGKARIEAFFRVMHMDHDREYPSWCGSDAEPRDSDTLRAALAPGNVMALPTLDQVRENFRGWVSAYNLNAQRNIDDLRDPVTGEKTSPLAMYQRHLWERRTVAPEALTLLEQVWSRPLAVSKRGLGLRIAGITHYYRPAGGDHPELTQAIGTDERFIVTHDPRDVSCVRVFALDGRYLCTAGMVTRHGAPEVAEGTSREAMKSALARRRAAERAMKQQVDVAALTSTPMQLAAQEQRKLDVERERARLSESLQRDPAEMPAVRLVGADLAAEAREVNRREKGHRLRKAAGAESMHAVDDAIDFNDLAPVSRAGDDYDDERDALSLSDLTSSSEPDEDHSVLESLT